MSWIVHSNHSESAYYLVIEIVMMLFICICFTFYSPHFPHSLIHSLHFRLFLPRHSSVINQPFCINSHLWNQYLYKSQFIFLISSKERMYFRTNFLKKVCTDGNILWSRVSLIFVSLSKQFRSIFTNIASHYFVLISLIFMISPTSSSSFPFHDISSIQLRSSIVSSRCSHHFFFSLSFCSGY